MSNSLTIASLTDPREVAFVAALFELGGPQHGTQAAMRAGYGLTEEKAGRAAAFLLASPRISRVIAGETKARFDAATAAAFSTLVEICSDPKAPSNARITAAEHILNRSSLGPPISRSASVHVGDDTLAELIRRLDEEERTAQKTIEGTARAASVPESYDD